MKEFFLRIKWSLLYAIMWIFSFFPLQNKAVFCSFAGKLYSDNPKAIFEEMRKAAPNCSYIWLLYSPSITIPGAQTVKSNSFLALYHLATAKLWVDNARKSGWVRKRKGQYYVQTWHGEMALKKIENDAVDVLPAYYITRAKHDSKIADLFISGSSWCSKNYRDAFWYKGDILECGMPRSAIFYQDNIEIKSRVYKFYGIEQSVHLLLYAPTFRKNEDIDCYNLDYEALLQVLTEKWPGKWKILLRFHPNIQSKQENINYSDWLLNGAKCEDINELIIASDIFITDYSSCMFSAMEAKKKVLIYASDIDKYIDDRGFYFNLEELPFPLATDNPGICALIRNYDEILYLDKARSFMQELGYCNNGDSAKTAVKYIIDKTQIF